MTDSPNTTLADAPSGLSGMLNDIDEKIWRLGELVRAIGTVSLVKEESEGEQISAVKAIQFEAERLVSGLELSFDSLLQNEQISRARRFGPEAAQLAGAEK